MRAPTRCWSSSTSPPRPWTPTPSTPCSSATPRRRPAYAANAGTITLLVSHRFATVRMADLIVYLEEGHTTEAGTHDELLAAGGRYAELFTLQASSYR
jgi:hypothetical protein